MAETPVAPVVKPLHKTATFWTGVAAIVTAVGGYFQEIMGASDSLEMIALALIGIFIRKGLPK
jgi:hypothetical protein